MAAKKTKTTKAGSELNLVDLRAKLLGLRLNIRAHQEKNTNAHKAVKKQIAQLLTSAKG